MFDTSAAGALSFTSLDLARLPYAAFRDTSFRNPIYDATASTTIVSPDDAPPDPSPPSLPPRDDKPPLLEYPSRPPGGAELDTESWTQVGGALAKVFGVILGLFVIGALLCGVLPRGCGMATGSRC